MSMITGITELTDTKCERGQVTSRPPVPYMKSKAGLVLQASEGEFKQNLLGNNPDPEDFYNRHLEKTGVEAKLKTTSELAGIASASLKKLCHAPVKEKEEAKAKRLENAEVYKEELVQVNANLVTQARAAYDLYRKLLADDTKALWDWIVSELHTKDPWMDLIGVRHKGMCPYTHDSFKVCIELHKLTVFNVDAAERLMYYLMCHAKKSVRYTIHQHVACMETLNKYVGLIPTIKNSPKAVASTEFGNIPFSEPL